MCQSVKLCHLVDPVEVNLSTFGIMTMGPDHGLVEPSTEMKCINFLTFSIASTQASDR